MRYTKYHAGKAVIKDKNKLSEAMEKLERLEDAEEKDRYHSKIPQCRISRDMKKMTRAVRSIREMTKNHIQVMD